ncbi:unnamed protein product [Pseudo-nitzschia multistriata]|uniref:Uncharacterized protein n=1 Tax=Pseudo-nitzschia multistriata TaxID=183589 RepID=A0A448Z6L3_9STRA|nr:unnamed protein product [Pseudo-nitzschia multistriata]
MSSFMDDGWGDDEDLNISDSIADSGDGLVDDGNIEPTANRIGDGWGDDDDFFNDDSTDEGLPPAVPAAPSTESMTVPVTSFDTNMDPKGNEKEALGATSTQGFQNRNIIPPTPHHAQTETNQNPQHSQTLTELSHYVASLERILSSINAVLEFEYNTFQKAEELVEYYRSRPQLAEYTRTKELERMNYEIVLPNGHVETNKDKIVIDDLLPDHAIVSRAANQSLLADLLQVITGHDLIVRPQYFTVCVATWCKFTIHKGDNGADIIDCRAKLSLSLPTEEGDRLLIAEVDVCVLFSPGQPMVEFTVRGINVLLKDYSKLAGVAEFLKAIEGSNEDDELLTNASPDMYRDAFLERSQRLFSLSSEGMMSAFQQVDSVVNIKGKLKKISSFIPDTDQLLQAEQEAIAFAEARKEELQKHQHSVASLGRPTPPPPRTSNTQFDQPYENATHGKDAERPKSILGGLVRSGWKTLANSVTLPDDDPLIYGEPAPPPPPKVPLYNKPIESAHMHRKEVIVETVTSNLLCTKGDTRLQDGNFQKQNNPSKLKAPHIDHNREGHSDKASEDNGFHEDNEKGIPDNNSAGLHQQPPVSVESTKIKITDIQCSDNEAEQCTKGEKPTRFDEETNKLEPDNSSDGDGWDDFGFDDSSYDVDNGNVGDDHDLSKSSTMQEQEVQTFVPPPDETKVDPLPVATMVDENRERGDGNIETRKRWVNPRPYRPYIKG